MIIPPHINLYPRHLSVVNHAQREHVMQLYELPAKLLDPRAQPEPPDETASFEELPILAMQYQPVDFPITAIYKSQAHSYENYHARYKTDFFLEFGKDSDGFCLPPRLLRFSIDFNPRDSSPPCPKIYAVHQSSARHAPGYGQVVVNEERVQIGVTGRRAVWIERVAETDEVTLMKMAAGPETGATSFAIGTLLLASELPFDLGMCESTAFDEVTGRLCLGLYKGGVYVIDF
jgi:hypothetical protein